MVPKTAAPPLRKRTPLPAVCTIVPNPRFVEYILWANPDIIGSRLCKVSGITVRRWICTNADERNPIRPYYLKLIIEESHRNPGPSGPLFYEDYFGPPSKKRTVSARVNGRGRGVVHGN